MKTKLKKTMASLLTVVMVLGLLPTGALASDVEQNQVVKSNLESMESHEDGKLQMQKSIVQIGENKFDITLKVQTEDEIKTHIETASASVVLVLDRSGSMGDGTGRLETAEKAAVEFINIMLGEGASEGNEVAIVSYASSAKTNVGLTSDITKLITQDRKGNDILKPSLSADGGTNIQAGLINAQAALKNAKNEQQFVVLLSDGAPTYSYRGTATELSTDFFGDYDFRITDFANGISSEIA